MKRIAGVDAAILAVNGVGMITCAILISQHVLPNLAWLWWLILIALGIGGPLFIRRRGRANRS